MPVVKGQHSARKARRARSKKAPVQMNVSPDDKDAYSEWDEDEGDDDDLDPSDSASSSGESNNQAPVPPGPKNPNLPGRTGMDSKTPGWASNGLDGRPLVHPHGRYYPSGPDQRRRHTRSYQPSYELPQQYPSGTSAPYMGYPSNNVQYPTDPGMQGMRPAGAYSGAPPGLNSYPNGYYPQQYLHPTPMQMHLTQTPPPPPPSPSPPDTPPPRPRTPKEDPEKIRLEAEIAAYKAMEEKQMAADKQKEVEAEIRKEAEEAFHRRMEDMRIAQEEAKKEIEKARFEAEEAARKRMQAEQDSEEERARRFKEFARKLERDVRVKVELEKIAEMAEREAKAKQSEDLERLAKLKMLKSMDEIIVLAKQRVVHGVTTQREMSVGATEKQGWLIETGGETEADNKLPRDDDSGEKSHTSVTQSNIPPQHATATTLRSVSSASVRRPDVSPPGSRTGSPLAVPDPPVLGYDSDDEGTLSRAGTDTLDPSESGRRGRAHHRQRHRDMYQDDRTQPNGALIDQIADAVVARLLQSPYKDALIRHPPQSQGYRQHLRPMRDRFDATPYRYQKGGVFGREDTAGRVHKDGRPAESSRRFFRPPKPAHLRGRSLRGSDGLSSLSMPPDTRPASPNRASIAPSNSQTSTPRRPPPPPVSSWIKTSGTRGQFGAMSDYSEVDTAIQEFSATAVGHGAVGSDETTRSAAVTRGSESTLRGELEKMNEDNLKAYLSQQENEEDFQKAYRHIFKDPTESVFRKPATNLRR